MTSQNLDNLVKSGSLKAEPASQSEFDGLLRSAKARLTDASNAGLSIERRFDPAYSASHALALAALRWHGYRSDNRCLVFPCLQHTLNVKPEDQRIGPLCGFVLNCSVGEKPVSLQPADFMYLELRTFDKPVYDCLGPRKRMIIFPCAHNHPENILP